MRRIALAVLMLTLPGCIGYSFPGDTARVESAGRIDPYWLESYNRPIPNVSTSENRAVLSIPGIVDVWAYHGDDGWTRETRFEDDRSDTLPVLWGGYIGGNSLVLLGENAPPHHGPPGERVIRAYHFQGGRWQGATVEDMAETANVWSVLLMEDHMVLFVQQRGEEHATFRMYDRTGLTWNLAGTIVPRGDYGVTALSRLMMSFDGNVFAIGAPTSARGSELCADVNWSSPEPTNEYCPEGSVWVARRSSSGWTNLTQVPSPNVVVANEFGRTVAVADGIMLVGADSQTIEEGRPLYALDGASRTVAALEDAGTEWDVVGATTREGSFLVTGSTRRGYDPICSGCARDDFIAFATIEGGEIQIERAVRTGGSHVDEPNVGVWGQGFWTRGEYCDDPNGTRDSCPIEFWKRA